MIARNVLFVLMAALAIAIGLYPILYAFIDSSVGFLSTKSAALLASGWWNTGFYTHIVFGGIALLTGWTQFIKRLRDRHTGFHRTLGKVYVVAVSLSGVAGIVIGTHAAGGLISASGFIGLGTVWLVTTHLAFFHTQQAHRPPPAPDGLQLCRMLRSSYSEAMVTNFDQFIWRVRTSIPPRIMAMLGAEHGPGVLDQSIVISPANYSTSPPDIPAFDRNRCRWPYAVS